MKRGFMDRNPRHKQSKPRDEVITQKRYCYTCETETPHTVRVGDFVDTCECNYCGAKGNAK